MFLDISTALHQQGSAYDREVLMLTIDARLHSYSLHNFLTNEVSDLNFVFQEHQHFVLPEPLCSLQSPVSEFFSTLTLIGKLDGAVRAA